METEILKTNEELRHVVLAGINVEYGYIACARNVASRWFIAKYWNGGTLEFSEASEKFIKTSLFLFDESNTLISDELLTYLSGFLAKNIKTFFFAEKKRDAFFSSIQK